MTDQYIDSHIDEINSHGSDIESRLYGNNCTSEELKEDNRRYAEGFEKAGEDIVWIEHSYDELMRGIISEYRFD